MFYPAESLRRGGRFYLCWMADAWPLRFRMLPCRALWSPGTDVGLICDGLMEVITRESGIPDRRFSLRLSSQLMRGVIRLYERKTNTFLGELCMLSAHIQVQINKKWEEPHGKIKRPRAVRRADQQVIIEELPQEDVADRIRISGHVVVNVGDITLRDDAIQTREPLNDNFGEEQPERALQQVLQDLTMEAMLGQQDAGSFVHVSGLLDPLLDTTDISRDMSRLVVCDAGQMQRISEADVSVQNVVPDAEMSAVDKLLARDIVHPATPEIQLRPAPAPLNENVANAQPTAATISKKPKRAASKETIPAEQDVELEALQEVVPTRSARRLKKLIIDKQTYYGKQYMRSRIEDDHVELRCKFAPEDRVNIDMVPAEMLFRRMATGYRTPLARTSITHSIVSLYARNLAPVEATPRAERGATKKSQKSSRQGDALRKQSDVENITTVQDNLERTAPKDKEVQNEQVEMSALVELEKSAATLPGQLEQAETVEAADLSSARKRRVTEPTTDLAPKRPRKSKQSVQGDRIAQQEIPIEQVPLQLIAMEKEQALLIPTIIEPVEPAVHTEPDQTRVSDMLQAAGLTEGPQKKKSSRNGSESEASESLKGSLDRTKVSLGDYSDTESVKFMRAEWGVDGTIRKIIEAIKMGIKPLTVKSLVEAGLTSSTGRMAAVRCFTSILKLKNTEFVAVVKNETTLEIEDIVLGRKYKTNL